MSVIGVDLEQFCRDPYPTGIQRVLHQLALQWPDPSGALFVVPSDDAFSLLTPQLASELLGIAFSTPDAHEMRTRIATMLDAISRDRAIPKVQLGQLLSLCDGWLLPEVSYLPAVLERLELFGRAMPITMIGYDALPMTDPGNYRFVPGKGAWVSEYFRILARADSVVCISEYARAIVLDRLRRSRHLTTLVANPGGDHVPAIDPPARQMGRDHLTRFLRLGTMEARKQPLEILRGFQQAIRLGTRAELVFVGNPSASSDEINIEVEMAIAEGYPVTWIQNAADAEVRELLQSADFFLSVGTEGYGIPVLEAIRMGTPVLFDGIQPAADLMVGHGSRRVPAGSIDEMAEVFRQYAEPAMRDALAAEVRPDVAPTWRAFTETVAAACTT